MRRVRIAGPVIAAACALILSFAVSVIGGEARTLALYAVRYDSVAVFDALNGTPIEALRVEGLPNDVAVGPRGDLYVASYRRSTAHLIISRFAPNAAAPSFTIVSQNFAGTLAVSNTGEIAVSLNCPNDPESGCYSGCKYSNALPVLFFEPGEHEPSRKRYICGYRSKPAYGPRGDLWLVSPYAPRNYEGNSYVFLGPEHLRFTQVTLQNALSPLTPPFAGPVLDGHGGLLVLDPGGALNVYGTTTGRLRYTVPIVGIVDGVSEMALSPDGAYLFVATVHGFVCAYDFPAGGMPLAIYDAGGTGKIAVGFI